MFDPPCLVEVVTWKTEITSASVKVVIDGERVKEGVIGRGWDVVSVVVNRHVTELMGEVDSRDNLGAGT